MAENTRNRIGKSLQDYAKNEDKTKMNHNIKQGIKGEQILYDMVSNHKMLSHCLIEVSLSLPRNSKYQKTYDSDVDMVIAAGNHIVLIDAKYFSAGKYYWRKWDGTIMEGLNKKLDTKTGEPIKTGKNMIAAVNRYQQRIDKEISNYNKNSNHNKKLPPVKVHAIVIFLPTGKRKLLPKSVKFLTYPGGIKSYLPTAGIKKVYSLLNKPKPNENGIIPVNPISKRLLKQLRK